MKKRLLFYIGRIRAGAVQTRLRQTGWIYQYARRYWVAMVIYTALGMVSTVVALLTNLVSRDLVDIITGHQTGEVIKTFCIMIGLNVGTTILNMGSNYASSYISMRVDAEIKTDIFDKILVTDWESLTNYHTGDLLTRWSSDASNISSGVLNFIPNLIIYIFRFLSAFAMVVHQDWTFAIFALMGAPVSLLMTRRLLKRMAKTNQSNAAMAAKMSGFNQETFSNIQTIKAFDLVKLYIAKLRGLQSEYIGMRLKFQKMSMGTNLLMSVVSMAVTYSSYGWGIYRVWSGAISYGTMTMFLGLSGTLTGTMNNLTSLFPTAISLTTSAKRLMDIVEMPREDYSHDEEVEKFFEAYKDQGIGLELRELDYAYKTGTQVFCQASMEAYPHEIVALVGPSGEGKTTMLRVILSLMQSQSGQAVLCGGRKREETGTEKIPLTPSTRKLFSYVPQGNTMFSGTIAENMRNVKQDATDEEIMEALKLACAWDFVEKLPEGINSKIKERGGGFSEGQAQRLSIARALLRKSPLLLLDEATSALDVATERKVLKNIMQDSYPRTCIVTTHRPTVLEACTRVYAIRDKKCVVLNDEEIDEMVRGF